MVKEKTNKTVTVEQLLASSDPATEIAGLEFESALMLLEQLVSGVEKGQLSLSNSVESYEKGMVLVEHLREILNRAETKLKTVGA